MKNIMSYLIVLLPILMAAYNAYGQTEDIVLENQRMRLVLAADGYARSLVSHDTGRECLDTTRRIPFCAITQYRPYDNENFLMYPAKPKVFPSQSIKMENGKLLVEFENTYDIAVIDVKVQEGYIAFNLERIDYRLEDIGIKRRTEIDEFALVNLPVLKKENFGEWLNVMWDEESAVCLMGTDPASRIDAYDSECSMTMYAGTDFQVQLIGAGAALIVSSKDDFLNCVAEVENDYDMPFGVESRRHEAYKHSYYELRDVTVDNIDEHIYYAKKGGFTSMVIYYMDFASTCGHFLWNDSYPDGIGSLKQITGKIREAGMIPGFHIHYSKVSSDDPYVCAGVPDPRLGTAKNLILAEAISEGDTVIFVEGNTLGLHTEEGRRIVQIDDELISYTDFTTEEPYCLSGCVRGILGTTAAEHKGGTHFRLIDVDTWPRFIRIDQNTTLQQEIAERLGDIYREAGFRFLYFDGAEDVPMPYWYNVSRSQMTVYEEMEPAPLFSEGALKSHYGWHILTRGNAFDLFPPERIRYAMKKYTLPCAERISKDFTSVNFGWVDYLAPDSTTIGMQPDMYEYICSKALAWDSPISLVGKLDQIKKHPRTDDNFDVISRWENAKIGNRLTMEQKQMLKDPDAEYLLLEGKDGTLELHRYYPITDDRSCVRAFVFEKDGRSCLICWHISGETEITADFGRSVAVYRPDGKPVRHSRRSGRLSLTVSDRVIIDTELEHDELVKRFLNALDNINN